MFAQSSLRFPLTIYLRLAPFPLPAITNNKSKYYIPGNKRGLLLQVIKQEEAAYLHLFDISPP